MRLDAGEKRLVGGFWWGRDRGRSVEGSRGGRAPRCARRRCSGDALDGLHDVDDDEEGKVLAAVAILCL